MTSIDNLQSEIMKQLQYYAADVKRNVDEAKEATAKKMVAELKQSSPKGKHQRKSPYAKGWAIKRTPKKLIVYNKTNYQLTHLLEHGHVKRNGTGRTETKVHIRPAEERGIREYLDKIEGAIQS